MFYNIYEVQDFSFVRIREIALINLEGASKFIVAHEFSVLLKVDFLAITVKNQINLLTSLLITACILFNVMRDIEIIVLSPVKIFFIVLNYIFLNCYFKNIHEV